MATENGRGGWDLTDADVSEIAAASGFEVEKTNPVVPPPVTRTTRQTFRAPHGQLRNPLGQLICGYVGRDPSDTHITEICMALDPCEVHGPQDPSVLQLAAGRVVPVMRVRPPLPGTKTVEPADLHEQLRDDSGAWSVRSRLEASLGRRALATRLADALPPLLGAELADRLDTVVTQALSEQQASITQELSDRYHEARARLDADAAVKLKEVHDERYRGHSRLS